MHSRLLLLALAVSALVLASTIPAATRPSIVLISVDTLRADHLSVYGYSRKTSPSIDALAARGLLFEEALVPQPQTSPSHASMLTGVTPWKHRVVTNGFDLPPKVDTLAAAFHRAGYDTAGVVAVGHIGRLRGFASGFDRFSDPPIPKIGQLGNATRRDANVVNDEVRRTVDEHVAKHRGQPMFLFVHYFDCHYPYRSWDKSEDMTHAYERNEQKQKAKQIRRYDDGIEWTDRHIGEMLRYVQAKLGNNVIIVLTADHGEQIGDHGLPVNHADIYRETVRVPLIIAGPGIGKGRVRHQVSMLDLPLTLARLGGTALRNALDGIDLLQTKDEDSSWFADLFGPKKEQRAFLITGAPTYTRSIALVKGANWYIKNFDRAYRFARVETPAPSSGAPTAALKGRTLETDQVNYTVDIHQYRPFWVTFEHTASSPTCAATAIMTIEPGLYYYRNPTPFTGSIRVTLPAARLDAVTLAIAPAKCAGTTRYSVSRELPPSATQNPELFTYLVRRRMQRGDELYDIDSDPLMLRNVIPNGGDDSFDAEIKARYVDASRRVPTQTVPIEQIHALRSLGYL